jgi:hypothetical protein
VEVAVTLREHVTIVEPKKVISRCKESEALKSVSRIEYIIQQPYFEFDEFLSDCMGDAYTFLWGRGPAQLIN